mgnify:CR=1 FL=1
MNAAVATAPLTIARTFDASPADLWRAWSEPELVARWFAPGTMRAEVLAWELQPKGRYRIRMHGEDDRTHTVVGRFREVKPGERLVMSWAWEGGEDNESTVTVTLAAHADGAELRIRHEGLPDEDSRAAHGEGWEGCLANLGSRLPDMLD